jgi:hypothetical protein
MTRSCLPAVPPGLTELLARSLPTDESVGYSHGPPGQRREPQSSTGDLRQAIERHEVPLLIAPVDLRSARELSQELHQHVAGYGAAVVFGGAKVGDRRNVFADHRASPVNQIIR